MMRRSSLAGLFAGAALVGVLGATGACYGPTEVTLYITTEHGCASEQRDARASASVVTAVKVGAVSANDAPVAELDRCTTRPGLASFIGSLVVVPSGARDARVTVQVTMTTNGAPAQECASAKVPDYCIVARRSFAFIEHASLTLPIRLYEACRGVTCADETTTCGSTGKCESATVAPGGCTEAEPRCESNVDIPPDAAADAPLTDDAETGADAAGDAAGDADAIAPRACAGPANDNVLATAPTPQGSWNPAVTTPLNRLASNTTHLFWPSQVATSALTTRIMRVAKNGVGGAAQVGPSVTGTAIAIAANDTHVWVVTEDGATRITLADGSSTTLMRPADVVIQTLALSPSQEAYFTVANSADNSRRVGYDDNGALSLYDASVGGDLLAVSATHLFTAVNGKAQKHLLSNMAVAPTPMNLGSLAPNGLAADGSTLFVSYTGPASMDGELTRYATTGPTVGVPTLLGMAEAPGAIAIGGGTFVLDHGKGGGLSATVRRNASGAAGPPARLPRITPLMAAVSGLAIDVGTGGCIYFIGDSGTGGGSRVFVYPKVTPSL